MVRVETDIEKYGSSAESRFTGTMLELLGINLASSFVSTLTLGIAKPWMVCWKQSWYADHTYINGQRMIFNGTGGQLFVEYIKWWLLRLVTLGIYGLWIPIKMERWVVQYTSFEGRRGEESVFTGTMLELLGIELASVLLSFLTLGIAYPWLLCWKASWYKKHTIISSEQLSFDGTGGDLFGSWILWYLLSVVTFGIYLLWVPIKLEKWIVSHTYRGVAPVREWICGHCGHRNPLGSRFCVNCSKPNNGGIEESVCPKCGRQRSKCICSDLWRKCPDCGKTYKGDECPNCNAPEFFMCVKCGKRPVSVHGDICAECSKKKCENCGNRYVGTKCPYCRANPMCSRCGKRPVTMEGEICDTCERRAAGGGFFPPDDL